MPEPSAVLPRRTMESLCEEHSYLLERSIAEPSEPAEAAGGMRV